MDKDYVVHRYGGTYTAIKRGDKNLPIFVHTWESQKDMDGTSIVVSIHPFDDVEEIEIPDSFVEYPDLGYINFRNEVVYLSRNPESQWRRGVIFSNIAASPSFDTLEINPESPEFIWALFNPEYFSVGDALEMLSECKAKVALSPDLCITHAKFSREIVLSYNNFHVGVYDSINDKFKIAEPLDFVGEYLNYPFELVEELL